MKLNTLKDLYIHELKDLYSAEEQIIKALPKMIKTATNQELAAGFQEHLEQTREHAERLEKILSGHSQTTRGPKCKGLLRRCSLFVGRYVDRARFRCRVEVCFC